MIPAMNGGILDMTISDKPNSVDTMFSLTNQRVPETFSRRCI